MFKVLRKADIILFLALCLLGAVLTVWTVRSAAASSSGAEVIITIDGAEYGRYSLDSDRTIPIDRNGRDFRRHRPYGGSQLQKSDLCPPGHHQRLRPDDRLPAQRRHR